MLAGGQPVSLQIHSPGQREARVSQNVVGWLPGSDPQLADEPVIVSAHLDHLGDNVAPVIGSTDRIANGAFDNAIGVGTMIEAARRLVQISRKQARGIVFVAFTAEEQGLLGSRWFVRHLGETGLRPRANVNIDMPILSYPLADFIVRGTGWTTLPSARQREGKIGLPIVQETDTAPPSDNLSFARIGVPTYLPLPGEGGEGMAAVRRFKSEHYHRASDDLSVNVDWGSTDQYVKFVQLLTALVANERPKPSTRVRRRKT
jgi:Zn-dependent M28 family amino/carboxypeptidase